MSTSATTINAAVNPHDDPQGPGDARPTAEEILIREDGAARIKGKTILITGASSGIGIETARVLAQVGAKLFLPVRDMTRGQSVVADIRAAIPEADITLLSMDLEDLDSVRACAAEFLRKSQVLHILINNAGVMAAPEGRTKQGFETQFGTNHLGHFLLFELLKPTLLASSTPSFNSRVVNLSSVVHRLGTVQLDDLDFSKSGYDKWKAYGQSKTANIWMAIEIERRYGAAGLHAYAAHPGGIQTNLSRHMTEGLTEADMKAFKMTAEIATTMMPKMFKSVQQGAATTIYAAVAKEFEGRGGYYLADCGIPGLEKENSHLLDGGHAKWAYDHDGARRLWAISEQLVGVQPDQH